MKIVRSPITRAELSALAYEGFGDVIKAVVDVRQEIMAIGGELHADEEVLLTEECGSKRSDTWGINLYPKEFGDAFIEFDSMVNIKPASGNRSRGIESPEVRETIKRIVSRLIIG